MAFLKTMRMHSILHLILHNPRLFFLSFANRLLKLFFNPQHAIVRIWRKFPMGPFELRLSFGALGYVPYAFGVWNAAQLAKSLDVPEISIIEFGVGGVTAPLL